jgi:hypothetical protein
LPGTHWEAGLFRAVLFTQQALPITTDIFTSFTGQDATRQEDRSKEGVRIQAGEVDDAALQITISPLAVDLIVSNKPVSPQQALGGGLPFTFGELRAELAKFERRIQTWLPKWEKATTRISLVVIARAPSTDRIAAYKILRDNLKSVKVDPQKMSDLIYRVNFQANTQVIPDGFYNRVSTWSAIQIQASASRGPGTPEIALSDLHYAQLEMDINTPGERTEPLPRDKIGTIYKDFFQHAAQIAENGEPS